MGEEDYDTGTDIRGCCRGCCDECHRSYLIYRQFRSLAEVSLEYAGLVVSSIREQEEEIVVDPLTLAGISMDHLSQVSGMVSWIWG